MQNTSIVVVLPATNDMCIIRNPITLNAKAKFRTANIKKILKKGITKLRKEIKGRDHHTKCKKSGCKSSGRSRNLSIAEECNEVWQ